MANNHSPATPIDDSKPGAFALHAQAARLETILQRLRVLTEEDSVERAMLVARLEKLLPDEEA